MTDQTAKKVEFELRLAERYRKLYRSANDRGKDFSLTLTDLRKLMKQKHCAYTGVAMIDVSDNSCPDNQRTIDRINPLVGYTKENTVAASYRANQLKETLLENKFTNPNCPPTGTNCVGYDFLKNFVKGLEAVGYEEPSKVD